MNTLKLMNKEMKVIQINNVIEIYFSNIAKNDKEKDWNYISVITKENKKLKEQIIELDQIYQFKLTKNEE